MPAFQTPVSQAGQKRKCDGNDLLPRKRQAINDPDAVQFNSGNDIASRYWMVQWRNPQQRKHKTWDGDAVMVVNGTKCSLYDLEGTFIGQGTTTETLTEGKEFQLGNRELEIDHSISKEEYLSGTCFGRGPPSVLNVAATPIRSAGPSKQFVPLKPTIPKTPTSVGIERKDIPLQPVDLISTSTVDSPHFAPKKEIKLLDSYWTANWRKHQHKKHKTWDGDAFVSHTGEKLTMISEEGKIMGAATWKGSPLCSGYTFYVGNKEVQLDTQVERRQLPDIIGKDSSFAENESQATESSIFFHSHARVAGPTSPVTPKSAALTGKFVTPASFYGHSAPKPKPKGPLHDPEAPGAVVMKTPKKEHAKKFNKKDIIVVPVVLDPIVARHLRPHQIEGVKFLYECVMGMRKHEGQGCILADEMGLGKTLQTITLVWTLLKQNPYSGLGPTIGKALVVCPVTLINNWKAEFHKWLGRDRVGVFVGDKDKSVIKQFINSRIHQVLVIGYEKLRTVIDELAYCNPPIGLIICDEGHRLKSANNKTSSMFKALRTPRRIILSGTPIQNDLGEFHAMADFCNPGLLDDYSTFRKVYETPILKSRTPDCTHKEKELGEARSAQLLLIAKSFVLRREATILKGYLPPKHEYVVFVTPTTLQLSIFSEILNPTRLDSLEQTSTAESLALITMLTKISNSPILLKATLDKEKGANGGQGKKRLGVEEAVKLLPARAQIEDFSMSGKLVALSSLLKVIRETTDEKCVLVSHYTSTLNILEAFCKKKNYTYFRLDGQTPPAKRLEYVNTFNKSSQHSRFIFLLSSKAGGVGLNLIGASRLCLIDADWNPSHDLQSMARIHRDGQKRPVFIYRFVTAGTIDEKIFQRQVTKIGLSNSLMGSGNAGSKSDSFTRKDLRDIFRIHPDTVSNTHDLLECPCDRVTTDNDPSNAGHDASIDLEDDSDDEDLERGFVVASQINPKRTHAIDKAYLRKKKAELAALGEWKHIHCLRPGAEDKVHDEILRELLYVPGPETNEPSQERSRIESLLSIDLDDARIATDVSNLSAKDVPGGTISFLFEKGSVDVVEPEGEAHKGEEDGD